MMAAAIAGGLRLPERVDGVAQVEVVDDSEAAESRTTLAEAFAGALAGALSGTPAVASPGQPTTGTDGVQRDLSRLDPEFRTRLERVIERMKVEFGHDVRINETVRSTSRQEALFNQGRTAPGPIVTWTLDSRHLTGDAADLIVDGSWTEGEGYRHLAEIAAQEGLRTLGSADPGHLELPRSGGASRPGDLLPAQTNLPAASPDATQTINGAVVARVAGVEEVARTAQVAQVARVDRVATVAAVAEVALFPERVAQVLLPTNDAADTTLKAVSTASSPRTAHPTHPTHDATPSSSTHASDDKVSGAHDDGAQPESASVARVTDAASAPTTDLPHRPAVSGNADVAGVRATDVTERIARVLQLQSSVAARSPSSLLLRLDDALTGGETVRVGLRDGAVEAAIRLQDPDAANRARARLGELQQALGRQGFTTDSLDVQSLATQMADRVLAIRSSDVGQGTSTHRDPMHDERQASRDDRGSGERPSPNDDHQRERPRSRRPLTGYSQP